MHSKRWTVKVKMDRKSKDGQKKHGSLKGPQRFRGGLIAAKKLDNKLVDVSKREFVRATHAETQSCRCDLFVPPSGSVAHRYDSLGNP